MRIIEGRFGGRNIIAPNSLPVRPTTDFAKSGLFNILTNHFHFEELKVLDLFCGSGNISFEFASRGTNHLTCVDQDTGCIKFVKETMARLKAEGIQCVRSEAFKFLKQCSEKFDIIFADPPFDFEKTPEIPAAVFEYNLLNDHGWLIVEHQSKRVLDSPIPLAEKRIYGNCAFSIYKNIP